MPRLSKRVVDAAEPGARELFVWDDALAGFGLRVSPGGAKTYFVQYRNLGGRTRRLRLGRHGAITPEQARKLAMEKLGAVATGRDPAAEREAARAAAAESPLTLAEAAELWLEAQAARVEKGRLREGTRKEYEREIRREVLPRLGRKPLRDFDQADAQRLHDDLATRPVMANRVLAALSMLWEWAHRQGHVEGVNPCRSVERYAESRRERHLSHAELRALGGALEAGVASGRIPARTAAAIRLIALTGCRPGEVRSLAWRDVDLERRVLRLRDAKTGDRDVWIAEPPLAVLRSLRPVPGSPCVFPSPHDPGRPQAAFRKPWAALLAAAEIPHTSAYVLRHTFATESEALGHSPYLTAELLGHSIRRRDMTRQYVHHVPDAVRRAADRVASRIAAALDGAVPADNVVPLRAH